MKTTPKQTSAPQSAPGMFCLCVPVDRGKQQNWRVTSNIQDFNNIITVLVGPDEHPFQIHQDAICDKSKFFKAACSKRWVEGQEKLVRLPEAHVDVFQAYSNWIYSGTIDAIGLTQEGEVKGKRSKRSMFFSLYKLGDMLDDIQLRRAATCGFFKFLATGGMLPDPNGIAVIWSSTPPGSLFRKLVVDLVVGRIDRDNFVENMPRFPLEFIQEVTAAALRKTRLLKFEVAMGDGSQYLEPEELEV
jgi:hypothetical protein